MFSAECLKWGTGLKVLCEVVEGPTGMGQHRVGIYSVNRPEAAQALTAVWSRRGVAVPLYDSLGANAVSFIIDHASLSVVLVEKGKLTNLIQARISCRPRSRIWLVISTCPRPSVRACN